MRLEWNASRLGASMIMAVHHRQACVGSTRGQRDPLQLAEHSGDAAGIVPAFADIPGRATLHHL